MIIASMRIHLHIPWVHSLKEKRSIVKRIIARTRQKFNVAIAEIEAMDQHQHIILGLACVANEKKAAERLCAQILNYLDQLTEGEIIDEEIEFR